MKRSSTQSATTPTPKRRHKEYDPLYGPLPPSVVKEADSMGIPDVSEPPAQYVEGYVKGLMAEAGLPSASIQTNWNQKLKGRALLLDNPQTKKDKQKDPKSFPKTLSSKEKKEKHVYDIPPEAMKFSIYEPLHSLWLQYMTELLQPINPANTAAVEAKLLKADYHGCLFTVTRSKCPSLVGITGICLHETENTFKLITQADKLKVIPKANSIFTFTLEGLVMTIFGNHFMYRSADRSARKFKQKPTTDL